MNYIILQLMISLILSKCLYQLWQTRGHLNAEDKSYKKKRDVTDGVEDADLARRRLVCVTEIAEEQCGSGSDRGKPRESTMAAEEGDD